MVHTCEELNVDCDIVGLSTRENTFGIQDFWVFNIRPITAHGGPTYFPSCFLVRLPCARGQTLEEVSLILPRYFCIGSSTFPFFLFPLFVAFLALGGHVYVLLLLVLVSLILYILLENPNPHQSSLMILKTQRGCSNDLCFKKNLKIMCSQLIFNFRLQNV